MEEGVFGVLTECNKSLALQGIPLGVWRRNQTKEVQNALAHYFECGECRTVGLQIFVGCPAMACEIALLVCAQNLGPVFTRLATEDDLEVVLAMEHIWGREIGGDQSIGRCCDNWGKDTPCGVFRKFWTDPVQIGGKSVTDPKAHTAFELLKIYEIFRRFGFKTAPLGEAIRTRFRALPRLISAAEDGSVERMLLETEFRELINLLLSLARL